jgi:hypothetical protein
LNASNGRKQREAGKNQRTGSDDYYEHHETRLQHHERRYRQDPDEKERIVQPLLRKRR